MFIASQSQPICAISFWAGFDLGFGVWSGLGVRLGLEVVFPVKARDGVRDRVRAGVGMRLWLCTKNNCTTTVVNFFY